MIVTLVALMSIGAFASRAAAQTGNPFVMDGAIDGGIPAIQDPQGNVKELGPANSGNNDNKIAVINRSALPMLDFTNPNAQVDLDAVWLQTRGSTNSSDQWLYFGWLRDTNSGSGFISIEFQKGSLAPACVYTGTTGNVIDFVQPASAAEAALIAGCNPWRERATGDFIILWDQQGNGLAFDDIKKRVFTCSGAVPRTCTLGPIQDLVTVEAAVSADRFRGEMAINLTDDVFGDVDGCQSFANVIPGTVTGNSDTADYKDTVFATFPPISNCGVLRVQKVTQDPSGATYTDTTNGFGYTVNRVGGVAVRFDSDAVEYPVDGAAPQTSIVRPNNNTPAGPSIFGGDTFEHPDLILAGNYQITETTPLPGNYQLFSIICTDATGAHNVTAGGTFAVSVPTGTFEATVCVITNRLQVGTPSGTTQQTARVYLFDSIEITGLLAGASTPAPSVTFRLFSDAACSAQVGSDQTATLVYKNGGTAADANTLATAGIQVIANGTYYWTVTFPGDAFNTGFTTGCGVETTDVSIAIYNSGRPGGGS